MGNCFSTSGSLVMVNNAATFGRSGIHDFILLRATAIILSLYTLFIAYFFISTPEITYDIWHSFFASMTVKVFTLLAVISILFHAWIGMWQVLPMVVLNVKIHREYVKVQLESSTLLIYVILQEIKYALYTGFDLCHHLCFSFCYNC